MVHSKTGRRLLGLLVAMVLVATAFGFTAVAKADTSAAPVTITIVNNNSKGTDDTDPKWPFDTVKAMEQQLGITLNLKSETDDRDQLLIASGDIGDIMYVAQKYVPQVIEGGLAMPLDDLVAKDAPDLAAQTTKLDFARQYLSDGTGKLYGITCFSGSDGNGMYPQLGFFSRWDYYKELGYPEMKSPDDVLNVINEMVKAHPTTADGKTVYGTGVFTDWGLWPFTANPMPSAAGLTSIGPSNSLAIDQSGNYSTPSTDINSPFWQNLAWYNKANQLGIFDKDSLTQKSDEYSNKCDNGQYMDIVASWWMTNFNQKQVQADPTSTVGYELLPFEGMQVYANNQQPIGAVGFQFMIGSKCPHPDEAMKLLNYLCSYDGIRQLMSGTPDTTIETVDGKPEIKADIVQQVAANDPAAPTFWKNSNFFGWTQTTIDPADGQPLNLFMTPRGLANANLPIDTDYSTHYDALYPYGVVQNFIDQGKMADNGFMNYTVLSAMDAAPDDITRIDNAMIDIETNVCAQAILAPDDASFQAVVDQCVSDLKSAGLDQSVTYWTQNYEKAKTAVAAMGSN